MLNNPLSFTDPTGYSWWTKWRRTIAAVAVAVVTYGVASEWAMGVAMAEGPPTAAAMAGAQAFAGSAAGFAAGGIQGGNIESAVYGAFTGGIGGAFGAMLGDYGMVGQMVGGGVNGYLQTGTGEGALRGAVAGAIPNDLGFSQAYRDNPYANVGLGVVRDGIRGSIVEGSARGFWRGVAYGQINNAAGHLWGAVSSNFESPNFRDAAFFYSDTRHIGDTFGYEAITIGNVIIGPEALSSGVYLDPALRDEERAKKLAWLDQHERGHISQTQWLGALYLPLSAASQWSGLRFLEYGPLHSRGYETCALVVNAGMCPR